MEKINRLLPDAKVVTITQIADAQIKINRMMSRTSRSMFLVIIVFVGGASIANYMYANVFERRREIGTLMALGAGSCLVLRIFLLKARSWGSPAGSAATSRARCWRWCSVRRWPASSCCRCPCSPSGPSAFPWPWRWWPVTFPPGVPPGSIRAPRSRRSDPC